MNKVVLTHDRLFMSVVGPSGCGQTELIFNMLKGHTFYPRFQKIYYFLQRISIIVLQSFQRTSWHHLLQVQWFRKYQKSLQLSLDI